MVPIIKTRNCAVRAPAAHMRVCVCAHGPTQPRHPRKHNPQAGHVNGKAVGGALLVWELGGS